jgi:4-amino-4-deoxychorismate lyase
VNTPQLVWVNGRDAATVSVLERALHYGDGLFETMACLHGRVRLLDLHLQRLAAGCERLGIDPPASDTLRAELAAVAAGCPRAVIKLLVTRGEAQGRGYGLTGAEKPNRITLRFPWPADDGRAALEGVRVRTATLRLGDNPALAGIKHCNRLEQVLARREWNDPGIAESLLYSSSGALVSGTMTNVFIVKQGLLCTPQIDRCGVAGVMRRAVLGLASQLGLTIREERLTQADVPLMQEMFLTNALLGVVPVRELDGRSLTPGALTARLREALPRVLVAPGGAGA